MARRRISDRAWAIGGGRLRPWARSLVALWLIASSVWIAIVCIDLCGRVSDQVAASQEIGADLARLDCDTGDAARCAVAAESAPSGYGGSWSEIAGLFLTYGCWMLLAYALAPPAAVLMLGLAVTAAAALVQRRRRAVLLPSSGLFARLRSRGLPVAAAARE